MLLTFNPHPEGGCIRAPRQIQRHPRENGGTAVTALERRISEVEQLATSQARELRIQFERIAHLQAESDILRIRFIKS